MCATAIAQELAEAYNVANLVLMYFLEGKTGVLIDIT
jgi:hypothetical protein